MTVAGVRGQTVRNVYIPVTLVWDVWVLHFWVRALRCKTKKVLIAFILNQRLQQQHEGCWWVANLYRYLGGGVSKDLCYLCVVWLDRWVFTKFWVRVFIVYIVTNANEFLAAVRAGYQHHSHANSITFRDQTSIWGIRLRTKHKTKSSINMNWCKLHCKHKSNKYTCAHIDTQLLTHNYNSFLWQFH